MLWIKDRLWFVRLKAVSALILCHESCLCSYIIHIHLLWYCGNTLPAIRPVAPHCGSLLPSSVAVFLETVLSRAQRRSVFTASPCDSSGLMVLCAPDSGIFLMKWDSLPASGLSLRSVAAATILPRLSPAAPPSRAHITGRIWKNIALYQNRHHKSALFYRVFISDVLIPVNIHACFWSLTMVCTEMIHVPFQFKKKHIFSHHRFTLFHRALEFTEGRTGAS